MIIKNKLQQFMPSRTDDAWTREIRSVVAELRKGAEDYADNQIENIVDEAVDPVCNQFGNLEGFREQSLFCKNLLKQVGNPGGGILTDLFFLFGQH